MTLLGSDLSLLYVVAGVILLYIIVQVYQDRHLRRIPAVGYTIPILNWVTCIQYIFQARKLIREGYEKHQSTGVFRIAAHDGWLIIVANPQLVEDVRRAPDDTLNFTEAVMRTVQLKYTIGNDIADRTYHVDVVRNALTRNLNTRFDDIRDEIQVAFDEEIGAGENWKELPAIETIQRIVSRVSNRLFVGMPLCRNRAWVQLNIDYTIDVAIGAMVLNIIPTLFKPLVSWSLTKLKAQRQLANKLVGPIIAQRLHDLEEHGEKWSDRPNDLITWLVEACPPELREVPLITNRLLVVEFGAIHTSSMTFSNVIYNLVSNEEWMRMLREEVERVVAIEGWSKIALAKMHRVDSFILETQRVHTIGMLNLQRWTMKPFTFSNGIRVPAGYQIISAAEMLQIDPAQHGERATEFNPWRWSDMRAKDAGSLKHQMVATNSTLLHFGHGRHACPGRFFAAYELKGMLAHLLLEYDVRFKEGERRPPNMEFGPTIVPPQVRLEFKKRRGS